MYRAMRPGPSSPIQPSEQVSFYGAGLGADEIGVLTFRKIRNIIISVVEAGVHENVIEC